MEPGHHGEALVKQRGDQDPWAFAVAMGDKPPFLAAGQVFDAVGRGLNNLVGVLGRLKSLAKLIHGAIFGSLAWEFLEREKSLPCFGDESIS